MKNIIQDYSIIVLYYILLTCNEVKCGDWVFEYKTKEQVHNRAKEAVGKTIRN